MTAQTTTAAATETASVLSVEGLRLDLLGRRGQERLVDDVTFDVSPGKAVALIGESGCGKTLTALAVLGLLPSAVRPVSGSIRLDGTELLDGRTTEYESARGRVVGAVFQDPMSSLDPTMTVGAQIVESRRVHLGESRAVASRHAVELLDRVGIPNPKERSRSFPHEFSGGMQQRAMIAAAIACEPKLLIADEPTTALDVTVQAEILELLLGLQRDLGMGLLLVTHDLGVVAGVADRVVVMYAGNVVERADVDSIFERPQHPYTAALIGSVPRAERSRTPLQTIPGRVPPAGYFPTGCRFAPRCEFVDPDRCTSDHVSLTERPDGSGVRCIRRDEIHLPGVQR
ncbi:ABC transporter ATP-binding protein [Ilumatobacter coccineus]|uniref:Oligopeptide ABC transporter ATP-binding protein n=1 Tax=Ilumatobacter coccineus (strain NBRC 103263 / KCTC 29153 / YM16-304) TaxID=1313172 RepID=A0A6C7E7N8_ILUCY|nr:ABC transporter ATP-binding protein [Ilumatobacter coccineus]BAN02072.1 oligopeptide ABC transporter ATP-binding protein [Ilumatobacter coccineus YM16-304]